MASDPTSESRRRASGMKVKGWFLGATFARLIAADVGRGSDLPTADRLRALLDVAKTATEIASDAILDADGKAPD